MSVIGKEKKMALDWIEKNKKQIANMSDAIWRYAEPALREYRSSKLHCDFLRENGFEVEVGIAGMPTAFVASYGSGKPVVATYAEYDATPGNSQKPVPYREPFVSHAPGFEDGHNILGVGATTGAVAAKVAMEKHDLKGTIKIFGTPAEKLCIKCYIARDGYLNDVDAIVAWHPGFETTVNYRLDYLGCYRAVLVDFHGEASYGGAPWAGKSALDALILMNVNVNFMKEQILSHSAWHSINEIVNAGGNCPTNIPELAQVWYVCRAKTLSGTDEILQMLKKCAKAAALVTGCSYELRIVSVVGPLLLNDTMSEIVYRNLKIVGPPKFTEEEKEFVRQIQRNLGMESEKEPLSETLRPLKEPEPFPGTVMAGDHPEFSWHAPLGHFMVTYSHLMGGLNQPSWAGAAIAGTSIAHKCETIAAKTIALTMIELLMNPSETQKAKKEFKERTKEFKYKCALPPDVKPPIDAKLPQWINNRWFG